MFWKRFLVRQSSYKKVFDSPEGRKVLADLRRFCRGTTPYVDVENTNATYLLAGRNEVWLRIMAHLNMSEEDIHQLDEGLPDD